MHPFDHPSTRPGCQLGAPDRNANPAPSARRSGRDRPLAPPGDRRVNNEARGEGCGPAPRTMARQARSIPGGLQDVASALDRSVAATPRAEALVSRYGRYDYASLDRAINAGAAALAALGIQPGDRIAASAGNHVDIVIAFFAAQRLGAIWVGISRALAAPEKVYQLQDAGVRLLLADVAAAEQIASHRSELPALAHVIDMEPGE